MLYFHIKILSLGMGHATTQLAPIRGCEAEGSQRRNSVAEQ